MLNPHEVSERIRILEEAFVSQAELIRELERENGELRRALTERNAGAESRGSGGRAAGEPAGGGGDAGVAPPPAAPDHSPDVGKTADERLSNETLEYLIAGQIGRDGKTTALMARELLDLRDAIRQRDATIADLQRQLAAGPTMPEKPSEAVVDAVLDWAANYGVEFPDDVETHVRDLLGAIRDALKKEQGR